MKQLLIPVLLMGCLAGCSSSPLNFINSGESQLLDQVKPLLVKQGYQDTIEVKNLHKTNGAENGDTYTLDIAYDAVFKVGYADLANKVAPAAAEAMQKGTQSNSSLAQGIGALGGAFDALSLAAMRLGYGDFKAGDKFVQQDSVTFTKTENGWQISSQPRTIP
jgi:hypothetical protein